MHVWEPETTEKWELSFGGALKTAAILGITGAGAFLLFASKAPPSLYTLSALGAAVGVTAYAIVDVAGRASALIDQHDRRAAENKAITPALLAVRTEIELIEQRRLLIDAIARLTDGHLKYAASMTDISSVVLDGDHSRLQLRVNGEEFPLYYAVEWLRAYQVDRQSGDVLPGDGDWNPDRKMPREDWRRFASAVSLALQAAGLVKGASGGFGPRWTTTNPVERNAALHRLQIYNAVQISDALHL